MGSALEADLAPGFAALEQYTEKARCGEPSDVYALADTLLYILTGQAPQAERPAADDLERGPSCFAAFCGYRGGERPAGAAGQAYRQLRAL